MDILFVLVKKFASTKQKHSNFVSLLAELSFTFHQVMNNLAIYRVYLIWIQTMNANLFYGLSRQYCFREGVSYEKHVPSNWKARVIYLRHNAEP